MTRILILEDDVDILNVMNTILKEFYEILPISDPQDWKQHVVKFKPDIAIVDVDLGKIDGINICRSLKSDSQTSHIKLVVTSAFVIQPERLKEYCDAFLEKPFEIDNFLEIIEDVQTK
ncbi:MULTISPECIES: response regulator [Pedobacter]|uniref:response regulator n=1 Tax=Pedobacter TaxID=84567 RepID=UPI001E350FDA|nr:MULTISPECIES: response regulator [Pedobacter]